MRPGSVFNPTYPAPVSVYAQVLFTLEDMVINALTQAAGRPSRAHHGAAGNIIIGTRRSGARTTVQYELTPGGSGAFAGGDGWTGCGFGGTGPKIACVEVLETEYPIRMRRFGIVPDSAGPGRFRGGFAYVRDYEILLDGTYSGGAARYMVQPQGVEGGGPGARGYTMLNPGTPEERKFTARVSQHRVQGRRRAPPADRQRRRRRRPQGAGPGAGCQRCLGRLYLPGGGPRGLWPQRGRGPGGR